MNIEIEIDLHIVIITILLFTHNDCLSVIGYHVSINRAAALKKCDKIRVCNLA